jgi:hypothetical protein
VSWSHEDLVRLFETVVTRETLVAYADLGKIGSDPWLLFDMYQPVNFDEDEQLPVEIK